MSYSVGERYWIPHDEHAWLVGTLKEFKNQVLEFSTEKLGNVKYRVLDLKQKLEPCGSHIEDQVENLVDLDELSEGAILHHIRNRFMRKHIYTHVGSILVAVNPFENLDIYSDRDIRRAFETSTQYPHVFVTAATAYNQLKENRKNQSVLISGESGAGKTETTKKVLTYLANVAPDSKVKTAGEPGMETKILQSNPLLEALGNAKTLRNNNSSRFGKWMKVCFEKNFRIQGCEVINYLLEKSRVVSQSLNERNYHIFYQLLVGSDANMKQRLYLTHPNDYSYLNTSQCITIENVDDAVEFKDTLQAMSTLQFSNSTIENVFRILSGILLLGNINYTTLPNSDACAIEQASSVHLQHCAELFSVNPDMFTYSLVEKKLQMGRGSVVSIKLNATQALDNRDTLAKTLYSHLFDYIIHRVNLTLKNEDTASNMYSIGILDIFGFEVFELNSFEQLCINYANEKLQAHFNEIIFDYEKLLYEEESIPLEHIVFEDNSECVNLLEGKPYGVFVLLEEECSLGNATDLSYISKLEKTFGANKPHANKYFIKNKTKPECFTVLHFAGGVEYNVTNFVEKNKDNLSVTCKEVMEQSLIPLVLELFIEKDKDSGAAAGAHAGGGREKKNTAKTTLGMQFRNQLIGLITNLKLTEPHFIRCIKPNHAKKPGLLTGSLALCQLKYAGLFEAIRIRKSGFAYRVTYATFANTYSIIVPNLLKERKDSGTTGKRQLTDADCCKMICGHMVAQKKLLPNVFYVGSKSRVFLKNNSDRLILDRERNSCILSYIIKLQRHIRSFIHVLRTQREAMKAKREFLQQQEAIKKQNVAALKVQRLWRGKQVRILFNNMTVFIELRKCVAKREISRIKDLLAKIDHDLASPTKSPMKSAMKSSIPRASEKNKGMLYSLFEQDIKIARIMMKLMEIQETLILNLQKAMTAQNITELNRLLLKAERLELTNHNTVIEARNLLLTLHKKRKIMKVLLTFLSNEDAYHEDMINIIEEAKVYDIDNDFISKVQSIYNNAGPRLKTRNKLRAAIEHIHISAIEQGVLEVMEIRQHHNVFAEAELRAARMMLRMCYFDSLLFPRNADKPSAGEESKGEGNESTTAAKIWDEPLLSTMISSGQARSYVNKPLLSPQMIELCHAIADSTQFPAIRKLQQTKLMDLCGSLERSYEVIRYYKWSKLCCTWKYPEIINPNPTPIRNSVNEVPLSVEDLGDEDLNMLQHSPMSPNTELKTIGKTKPMTNSVNITPQQPQETIPSGAEEFYLMDFTAARSNAYVIRCLHQDFDMFLNTTNNQSASLDAALGNVEISTSMQDALVNLDLMNDVNKNIVLPNGSVFTHNKTSKNRRRNITDNDDDVQTSLQTIRNSLVGTHTPSPNKNSPKKSLARSNSGLFAGYATAPREKIMRKAPMPNISIKRVDELDDNVAEKQLHLSRVKKVEELNKMKKDLNHMRRSDMNRIWK